MSSPIKRTTFSELNETLSVMCKKIDASFTKAKEKNKGKDN